MITAEEKSAAEQEIIANEKIVDYDTKEYPVETLVQKYLDQKSEDENEIFVPDYQREHIWSEKRQSKFIESVLIGLPIPYIFVADIGDSNGRLEIVDGSQRIRTLAAFLLNDLKLTNLKKLPKLEGFKFSDLPLSRQRRFKRRSLRMVELTQKANEDVRRDIFERINTGSDILKDMEVRRGTNNGPLLQLIEQCARLPKFKQLAPLSESSEKRRLRDELVLRFFAYLENYQKFERRVKDFLDQFIEETQLGFNESKAKKMKAEFERMLDFVEKHFPAGFAKEKHHTTTPRIRLEAIAVGVALALRNNSEANPSSVDWINSAEFKEYTTSDASNSRPKVVKRIEYVRDNIV